MCEADPAPRDRGWRPLAVCRCRCRGGAGSSEAGDNGMLNYCHCPIVIKMMLRSYQDYCADIASVIWPVNITHNQNPLNLRPWCCVEYSNFHHHGGQPTQKNHKKTIVALLSWAVWAKTAGLQQRSDGLIRGWFDGLMDVSADGSDPWVRHVWGYSHPLLASNTFT